MLSPLRKAPLGLLALGSSLVHAGKDHNRASTTTVYDEEICTGNVTVFDTTTVLATQVVDVTHYVNVTLTNTDYTTTTILCTVNITETDTDYVTTTTTDTAWTEVTVTGTDSTEVTVTGTDSTEVTVTGTDSVNVTVTGTDYTEVTLTGTDSTTVTTTGTAATTVTTTDTAAVTVTTTDTAATTVTTTDTVPATITTFTTETETLFTTTYEPCPKTCSVSADTVSVFYWPTDRPYSYPSTHVDKELGYTFTSPSVYLLVPTAAGVNYPNATAPLPQEALPYTTSWILELDLYEVSTIASGSITRQLTLSDLGTDCPRSVDKTAIATLPQSCNPILAAPKQVSSWAYPCNACSRFGLVDPPYAVPTLTGPLIEEPTTVVLPPVEVTVTASPPPPPPAPPAPTTTMAPAPAEPEVGVVEVVYYYEDGVAGDKVVSTGYLPTTGITGTVTSSVEIGRPEVTSSTGTAGTAEPSTFSGSPTDGTSVSLTLPLESTAGETAAPTVSVPVTGAGAKVPASTGVVWFVSSLMGVLFLL